MILLVHILNVMSFLNLCLPNLVTSDAVGKDTYAKSLKCLAPLGHIIFCGNASGPVPPIDPLGIIYTFIKKIVLKVSVINMIL